MNSTSTRQASTAPRLWWRILRWMLVTAGVCVVFAGVAVLNAVTLTRDAAALRNDLLKAVREEGGPRIQFTAGPVLLSLVRTGLGFAPDLPSEARLALRSVRKASVGIYKVSDAPNAAGSGAMFAQAEATMQTRGWRRVVAVSNMDAQVMVFAREEGFGRGPQKLCVAVRAGDRLIVVAGTVNPEPLVQLVAEKQLLARR